MLPDDRGAHDQMQPGRRRRLEEQVIRDIQVSVVGKDRQQERVARKPGPRWLPRSRMSLTRSRATCSRWWSSISPDNWTRRPRGEHAVTVAVREGAVAVSVADGGRGVGNEAGA